MYSTIIMQLYNIKLATS